MRRLILTLDAMGGDIGPAVTVPAAIQVLKLYPQLELLLVGDPKKINILLVKTNSIILERLTIIPAESVISSDVKPSKAIRFSQGTSMRIALELIKDGHAQACISAGNTGVLMGLAKLILKSIKNIDRPALMVLLPHSKKGKTVMLDSGANISCNEHLLVQFAIIGTVISEYIVGTNKPRVALLNIGQEETKGLNNIRYASKILRNIPNINYIGYLEANDLLTGKTDVLICDGFVGNITLKTLEGIMRIFLASINPSFNRCKSNGLIPWIKKCIKYPFLYRYTLFNPDRYNGAYLVGLRNTIVVKSHGAANEYAFVAAIRQAIQAVEQQIPQRIAARLDEILPKSD